MLKLAIAGAAGRMGRRLVALATEDPDLTCVGAVDVVHLGEDAGVLAGVGALDVPVVADLAQVIDAADAVIDFSSVDAALPNARLAAAANRPIVIGTTGLPATTREALAALGAAGARIVFAPNFSVGINLLFALVEQAAKALPDTYDIEIVEMHHRRKKDAPSGTAERLGEVAAAARGLDYATQTAHGREGLVGARPKAEIGMHSVRGGDVTGEHTVIFAADGERLELTHRASSRDVFVHGALHAAKFIATAAPGLYDMRDILGL